MDALAEHGNQLELKKPVTSDSSLILPRPLYAFIIWWLIKYGYWKNMQVNMNLNVVRQPLVAPQNCVLVLMWSQKYNGSTHVETDDWNHENIND